MKKGTKWQSLVNSSDLQFMERGLDELKIVLRTKITHSVKMYHGGLFSSLVIGLGDLNM